MQSVPKDIIIGSMVYLAISLFGVNMFNEGGNVDFYEKLDIKNVFSDYAFYIYFQIIVLLLYLSYSGLRGIRFYTVLFATLFVRMLTDSTGIAIVAIAFVLGFHSKQG